MHVQDGVVATGDAEPWERQDSRELGHLLGGQGAIGIEAIRLHLAVPPQDHHGCAQQGHVQVVAVRGKRSGSDGQDDLARKSPALVNLPVVADRARDSQVRIVHVPTTGTDDDGPVAVADRQQVQANGALGHPTRSRDS